MKYRLCPVLGNYSKGEPHSVVILDNAAIHMHPVVELINSKGAILLYAARYSPDINPIEYFFKVYKDKLKRTSPILSWYDRHLECINCVSTYAVYYVIYITVFNTDASNTTSSTHVQYKEVKPDLNKYLLIIHYLFTKIIYLFHKK